MIVLNTGVPRNIPKDGRGRRGKNRKLWRQNKKRYKDIQKLQRSLKKKGLQQKEKVRFFDDLSKKIHEKLKFTKF